MELFADMALYAYVVAEEPGQRVHFETLPRVTLEYRLLKPVARDLRYFEAFYPSIVPLTYVCHQFRFTMMARRLIDTAGPGMLRRLWDTFALSDQQLAGVLGDRVHPEASGSSDPGTTSHDDALLAAIAIASAFDEPASTSLVAE